MAALPTANYSPTVSEPRTKPVVSRRRPKGTDNIYSLLMEACSAGLTNVMFALLLNAVQSRLLGSKAAGLAEHVAVSVLLFCFVFGVQPQYSSQKMRSFRSELLFVGIVTFTIALLLVVMSIVFQMHTLTVALIATHAAGTCGGIVGWRWFRKSNSNTHQILHVAILGMDPVAIDLADHLESNPDLGYRVIGFVDRRSAKRGGAILKRVTDSGIRVLGSVDQLGDLAKTYFLDEVLITTSSDRELVKRVAIEAQNSGLHVRVVPDLYDGLGLGAKVEYFGEFPTMMLHETNISTAGLLTKRLIDLVGAACALLCLAPAMAALALAIRLESKGPIFYRSVRIGRKGRSFTCFKFRTMIANAEGLKASLAHLNERDNILFKISNDPRLTRVGRVLRKYSLDELPQFFNVLLGDMSLVGPRPPVAGEVNKYSLDNLRRLEVVPGITGLWQVEARRNPSFDSYVSLDVKYIDTWSIWLDFRIMLKTVGVVLAGTGQ
jgi:exopolysaccharide biosynthesis polyprenyl glycosylphosphotransferase